MGQWMVTGSSLPLSAVGNSASHSHRGRWPGDDPWRLQPPRERPLLGL